MATYVDAPSSGKIAVVIIDPQNDFHAGGSLAVPGADNDCERYSKMIENNLDKIGEIYVTLDSHYKEHIAHANRWNSKADGSGVQPSPFSRITHQDLLDQKWFPSDSTTASYCASYAKALEDKGRFMLTIWPDHCIIGSEGNNVTHRLQAALDAWEARQPGRAVRYVRKGQNNDTEMYSAIEAEVPIPADPRTQTNFEFVGDLKNAKKVIVCGQALSHCVNYTTRDLVKYWAPRDPRDIILLLDGASPVPGCEADATKFVEDMKAADVTLSLSTDVFLGV